LFGGFNRYQESYNDPAVQQAADDYQQQQYGGSLFNNGYMAPLGIAFVQETTIFREFGPLTGNTMRLSYEVAPKIGNTLSRQTLDLDARYYKRIGTSGLLALRARSYRSWGEAPTFIYFGGNSEMRGYDYLEFLGSKSMFYNAELRFPLIEAMLTPIGVMGGIRGVFFANMGGGHFDGQNFTFMTNKSQSYTPIVGYDVNNATGVQTPIFGTPRTIDGFRLVDARGSYGVGLQTFALGFPVHFDWSWRTLFNKDWEDALFAASGGSHEFRSVKFDVWMGYDF
jgi:outer membrane protein assembly factor BamA